MKTILQRVNGIATSIEFWVGQCAQENDDLLRKASPDDMWFHVSSAPSCHVVAILPSGTTYTKKQLKKIAIQGGVLCKQYSRFKSAKDVAILYARVHDVHRTDTVGTVTVETFSTVVI